MYAKFTLFSHIELRSMEKGYLQKIFVDEGQKVRKGQAMFRIMPNIYQAELQKAKAEANAAEIEYKNTKLLADSKVVSPNELALSKAKLDKAKAEVNLAATHLGFTNIKAPFDGIIDHLMQEKEVCLEEGELLTSLSDNSKMWVYFNVPEAEYLNYIVSADNSKKPKVKLLMANNMNSTKQVLLKPLKENLIMKLEILLLELLSQIQKEF